jgi:transcriptional regulator with XRE-family HTH domain
MELNIPSSETVRAALAPLTLKQLDTLAELSGVPATTIYKIKRGETENPGIETLRKFAPHIAAAANPA